MATGDIFKTISGSFTLTTPEGGESTHKFHGHARGVKSYSDVPEYVKDRVTECLAQTAEVSRVQLKRLSKAEERIKELEAELESMRSAGAKAVAMPRAVPAASGTNKTHE